MDSNTFACLGSRLEGNRVTIQIRDQLIKDGLQVRVGRIAVRVSLTAMEEDVKGPNGSMVGVCYEICLRREGRIEDGTAHISGKQAQYRQSQARAPGNAFQVYLLIA